MIKATLQIAIREIIRFVMRIFCIFPIKNNRVIFQAYDGKQYSCNPKYICEYMLKNGKPIEIIWSLNNPDNYKLAEGIVKTKCYSLKWMYYVMTSKVIVSNTRPKTIFPARKKQVFIETWHAGGAYKEVGINVKSQNKWEKWVLDWSQKKEAQRTTLFLSSSEIFTKYNINIAHDYYGDILCSGMPRNDIFFNQQAYAEARERTRKELGLTGNVVLFAPTWRKSAEESENNSIVKDALDCITDVANNEWNGNATILYRGHHWSGDIRENNKKVKDVTSYPDMQELLCAADILITDYSSSIWDFAFTQKPCFLFVPDVSFYGGETHGFCTPIESWPGKICETKESLYNGLANIDKTEHARRASDHIRFAKSYETGIACSQTSDAIMNYIRSGSR